MLLYQQKHCHLELKETGWNGRKWLRPPNIYRRETCDKTSQLQTCSTFYEKGRLIQRSNPRPRGWGFEPQGRAKNHRGLFPGFETKGNFPGGFHSCLGLSEFFFFPLFSLLRRNLCKCYPMPSSPLCFWSRKDVSWVKVPQIERTCATGLYPVPDLYLT